VPRVVALTGATGFIGGSVAHRLSTANWQIKALVRPASRRNRPAGIDARWIEGDLDNLDSLRRLVQDAEAVVHCAGAVRGARAQDFSRVNEHGVARLVQAAVEQKPTPSFVLISSLAARVPYLSPYAASKRAGEEVLAAGAGEMQWVALRPPAVYGPGDKELFPLFRWMYRGIAPILGPADGRFSLLYVDDLAEAIMHCLACGNTQQGVFELHDGKPNGYAWNDLPNTMARLRGRAVHQVGIPSRLVKMLAVINVTAARVAGYAPMLTPGKCRELRHADWVCDNTLLSREVGWVPSVSLEEGLRRTLESDR
jgi:nucleoside-diphosphate-sugar epimerase